MLGVHRNWPRRIKLSRDIKRQEAVMLSTVNVKPDVSTAVTFIECWIQVGDHRRQY